MYPLKDRLMRAFNAEETNNLLCFSERTAGRVEPDGERPDGRRRPLTLPTFKIRRLKRLSEQFLVEHRHRNQRTAHFSNWLNLAVPILVIKNLGVDQHQMTVHRWVQKVDLQPIYDANPNHVAVD